MKKEPGNTRDTSDTSGSPQTPEQYLDIVRNRVTRYFCIFCFILALVAVPATLFARDRHTQIINTLAVLLYGIPFVMTLKNVGYRTTAKVFVLIATLIVFFNGLSSNCDLSPATIVWYFVYIVFAHLVLGLRWASGIGLVGFLSVLAFAIVHLTGHQYINADLLEDSVLAGAPVAMAVAIVQLLYLMSVYKKLWNELFCRVVTSDRQKSQLAGILSHDLRNYLGAVQGICSLMVEDLDMGHDKEKKNLFSGNLSLIDQAATGALQLVEEVVAASRDTSSEQQFFVEEIDLRHFIEPIFQRYQVLARSKGVRFVLETDSEPVIAAIHRDRFSRVIENLLSNALKFTGTDDTVVINVTRSADGPRITIADTGIGIPADLQPLVFEPFTRAGRSGTAHEKSIGLGLSIVKKYVELHGGVIHLESTEGKGTMFSIELPVLQRQG